MPTKPALQERQVELRNGQTLRIREADPADARSILDYVETIAAESSFLSFGPGEHGFSEEREVQFIREYREKDNRLFILGFIDHILVASLTFAGGTRSRTQHAGEFGMSVRQAFWNLGIASLMIDVLVAWAREHPTVTKINLRVRTDNARAISLYERKGFVHEGRIRRDVQIDGEYFANHWMGLEL